MPDVITIDRRFNGPPDSANGGYACGLIAGAIRQPVSVRLQKPPPLETPLTVEQAPGQWRVLHDGDVVATAAATKVDAAAPPSPGYVAALAVARHYAGFKHHFVPTCFVCGPKRNPGDGLRIFPGAVAGAGIVAAPWLPDVSLMDPDGKVRPEFIWAALDCPGYYASIANEHPAVLGQLAVRIDRRVPADEPCVVIGWPISSEGRKHEVGTALYAEDGDLCALGLATWIEKHRATPLYSATCGRHEPRWSSSTAPERGPQEVSRAPARPRPLGPGARHFRRFRKRRSHDRFCSG